MNKNKNGFITINNGECAIKVVKNQESSPRRRKIIRHMRSKETETVLLLCSQKSGRDTHEVRACRPGHKPDKAIVSNGTQTFIVLVKGSLSGGPQTRTRLVLQGGHLSWAPVRNSPLHRRPRTRNGRSVASFATAVLSLIRRKRRFKTGLPKKLRTDAQAADFFGSIVIDNSNSYELSFAEQKSLFEAFKRVVKKKLLTTSKAYLHWVYEYTWQSKLHMHFIATFDKKLSLKKMEHQIRRVWGNIIGSTEKNIVCLRPYQRKKHIGYFTSSRKDDDLLILLANLGKGRAYGTMNNKNAVKAVPELIVTSRRKGEEFRNELAKEAIKAGLPNSTLEQLKKGKGSLAFLPESLIRKTMEAVFKK